MNMPRVTIVFSILLILLGLVGYFGHPISSDAGGQANVDPAETAESPDSEAASGRSITAMIPAFAGGLLLLFGCMAMNEKMRMHAMHGAVLIGLLGFLAAAGRSIPGLIKLASDSSAVNGRSLFFVSAMAILCAVFVILCVRSFIQARRQRKADDANVAQ